MQVAKDILDSLGVKFRELEVTERGVKHASTPAGVLSKIIVNQDGNDYYVKTGETSVKGFGFLFPVSEMIAYEVGKLLGFNVTEYELWEIPAVTFMNKETVERNKELANNEKINSVKRYLYQRGTMLASVSKSFLNGNWFTSFADFTDYTDSELYDEIISSGFVSRKSIDQMIVFDYLICNEDRHLNNFGYLTDSESGFEYAAPLFDHGQSLLSVARLEELNEYGSDYYNTKYLKPFGYESLTFVDWGTLDNIHVSVTEEQLHSIVDKYKGLIGNDERVKWIKRLLGERWSQIVRKILSQTQEHPNRSHSQR